MGKVASIATLICSTLLLGPSHSGRESLADTTQAEVSFAFGQGLGLGANAVATADLDLDDDQYPDLVLARTDGPAEVWLNRAGSFFDSGLRLGTDTANDVVLEDLNGDGWSDAFLTVGSNLPSGTSAFQVWVNQGTDENGSLLPFLLVDQAGIPNASGTKVALGELDGNDGLDAVLAGGTGFRLKWLRNDGTGTFTDFTLNTGWLSVTDIALGDVDNDGDVDVLTTGSSNPSGGGYEILHNQGNATFGSPVLTRARSAIVSTSLSLDDLDNDDDLDIVFTNQGGAREPEVHLNEDGQFQDSGQRLNPAALNQTLDDVALGDLDGDEIPDVFFTGQVFDPTLRERNWLFLNDGFAGLTDSGIVLEDCPAGQASCLTSGDNRLILPDIDGDGDLDAVVVSRAFAHVWVNQLSTPTPMNQPPVADAGPDQGLATEIVCCPPITLDGTGSFDPDSGPQPLTYAWSQTDGVGVDLAPDATVATPWFVPPRAGTYRFQLVVSDGADQSEPDLVRIEIAPEPSCVRDCAGTDPCFVATLACAVVCAIGVPSTSVSAVRALVQAASTVIDTEALLQTFRDVRDQVLAATSEGQRYIQLYETHTPEITELLFTHADLLTRGSAMLLAVQPGFDALLAGQGASAVITSDQVQAVADFLDALSAHGSAALQEAIAAERTRWGPLEGYIDRTMAEVQVAVLGDGTPPLITPQISGAQGANGWYVGDVTVAWAVVDPESAITASDGCASAIVTTDTPGQTLVCTATSAGGTASQAVTIRRDATAPVLDCPPSVTVDQGEPVNLGTPTVSDAVDPTPEVASDAPPSFPVGTTTVNWTATDAAGNQVSCAQQVTVNAAPPPPAGNTRPIALPDAASTRRGQSVRIKVLANDYDRERNIDPATVTIVQAPAQGTAVTNGDGTVTYTAPTQFRGLAYFSYRVKDLYGLESNRALVVVLVY